MCVPSLSCYLISGLIPAYQQAGFDQSGRWVINTCQSRSCSGQRSSSGPHREGVRHDVASSAAPPGVRRSGQSGIGVRADRTRRCLAGWVPRPRATRPKLEIEPYHPRALLQNWPFAKKKKKKCFPFPSNTRPFGFCCTPKSRSYSLHLFKTFSLSQTPPALGPEQTYGISCSLRKQIHDPTGTEFEFLCLADTLTHITFYTQSVYTGRYFYRSIHCLTFTRRMLLSKLTQ